MGERGKNYAFWLSFFRGAGIMSGFDTKYALAFDENRIQPDMLLDLNKEYLREMEITAMGDIIAILKHAKRAYEESKTMAFEKSKAPQPQLPQKTTTVSSEAPSKNLPTIRPSVNTTVEKVTTTTPTVVHLPTSTQKLPDKSPSSTVVKLNPASKIVVPKNDSAPATGAKAATNTQMRTFIIPNKESSSDSEESSINGTPSPKKVREIAGHGTNITVRVSGSDSKPDKAQTLFKNRLGPSLDDKRENEAHSSEKRNIFDRLGGSSASKVSSSSTGPRVQCRSISPRPDSKSKELSISDPKNSVFGRLGGRDRYDRSRSRSPVNINRDSFRRRDDRQFHSRSERNRSPIYTERRKSPPQSRFDVHCGAVKRVTIGASDTRENSFGSKLYSDKISTASSRIGEPFRRSSEISSTSRLRCETETLRGRVIDREAIKPRLGGGGSSSSFEDEPMRSRSKIVSSKVIAKNTLPKNVRVGQVLKSTKFTRPDGSSGVKKFVVKSISRK